MGAAIRRGGALTAPVPAILRWVVSDAAALDLPGLPAGRCSCCVNRRLASSPGRCDGLQTTPGLVGTIAEPR